MSTGGGVPAPLDLALDQNFPEPILDALGRFIVDIRLIPLRRIDPRLPSLEDRELLIALHQLGYRGLVTNNYKMLKNPRELAAVIATRLTVFAIEGVGHDPLRATGALLLDLPGAVRRMHEVPGRVFWLRPRQAAPQEAWELFQALAKRRRQGADELYREVEVASEELARPVLD